MWESGRQSVFREALCGSCDLPVKILPLSGNSNHLEKYTVNVIRIPLAIKSKLPEAYFSTSNEGGIKGLKTLFQAPLLIYKNHSVKVLFAYTRYCDVSLKAFSFMNLHSDIVSALVWPGPQNHPVIGYAKKFVLSLSCFCCLIKNSSLFIRISPGETQKRNN